MKELFYFSPRNDSLGLCLSGGGALGIAHIGVIQALEDHGIYPTHIAGSSMGAIIGTLYAAGYSPEDMMRMIKNDKLYKITKIMSFHPTLLKSGISSHHLLRSLIRQLIPHNSFEGLRKKMHICVVNLNTADWEIVDSGNNLDVWVTASASIPGVFETVKHENVFYVDGGLLNNMPAQAIKYCQNIIGVDVIPHIIPSELNKPFDSLAFALRTMAHSNSRAGHKLCRFVIEPRAVEKYHEFSFDAYADIYQYGYKAATNYITQNPELLKLVTPPQKWAKELKTKVS